MIDAVPLLLKLSRDGASAMLLGCRGKPHAIPDQARDVPILDWSTCPLCLSRQILAPLRDLSALAKISPLEGWPDRYALWAVRGILAIRAVEG